MLGELHAPLGEVGEHQHPLLGGVDDLDDLLEAGELAGTAVEGLVVVAVGHRVVADLLEGGDGGQDLALALVGALLDGGLRDQGIEDRLVEADLLRRHGAVVELVDAVGELGGDGRLGLRAAEDEDAVEGPEGSLGGVTGAGAVDRQRGDERGPGSDQAGVGEVEDGPEVAQTVLDRGARQRHADPGGDASQLLGGLVGRVLDRLGLVEDEAVPLQRGDRLHVAHGRAVGRDHHVGIRDLGSEVLRRGS